MATDPTLLVSELFFSIQGESTHAGLPCFFIRLAGCNLCCSYCDARYTQEEAGREMNLAELVARAGHYPGALVEITGGEPLLQDNVYPLMQTLIDQGRTVLLETNGSLSLDRVDDRVVRIMDLKCPDSTMVDRMEMKNLGYLNQHDEVKFVLSSRQDYDWAVAMINEYRLIGRCHLLFSANTKSLPAAELAGWILADQLPVRLQLQLHKILWPAAERGV